MAKGFDAGAYLNANWKKVKERLHDRFDAPYLWSSEDYDYIDKNMLYELPLPSLLEKRFVQEPTHMVTPLTVDYSKSEFENSLMKINDDIVIGGIISPKRTPRNPKWSLLNTAYGIGLIDCNPFYSVSYYIEGENSRYIHNYINIVVNVLTLEHLEIMPEKSMGRELSKLFETFNLVSHPVDCFKHIVKIGNEQSEDLDSFIKLVGRLTRKIKRNANFWRKSSDGEWEHFNFQ